MAATGLVGRFLLLCLGIWLHAADMLVTAALMPSVVAEIGGTAWVAWSISLYELGSIIMGAAIGRLAQAAGLRSLLLTGALVYGGGCATAAAAPDMAVFLAGRLVQGFGGGLLLSLSYIAVQRLFPERLWTPLLAVASAVWGAAALVGPLIGGVFADLGSWRGAFIAFGVQAAVLCLVARRLPQDRATGAAASVPGGWTALALLTGAILLICAAGTLHSAAAAAAVGVAGLLLLLAAGWRDRRAVTPMMPRDLMRPLQPFGAGLAMVLGLAIGTCAFWTYGPLLLQRGFGVDPLVAGGIIAGESIAWSIATLALVGLATQSDRWAIRLGAATVAVGASSLALTTPAGWLPGIAASMLLQGAGMGLAWPGVMRRAVALAGAGERDLAASAPSVVQRIGYALGAALSGLAANAAGVADGMSGAAARSASLWVFASAVPVLLVAMLATLRFTASPLERSLGQAT